MHKSPICFYSTSNFFAFTPQNVLLLSKNDFSKFPQGWNNPQNVECVLNNILPH